MSGARHRSLKKEKAKAEKVNPLTDKAPLLGWDEIPRWMRDNQYILGGYRIPTLSYGGCMRSLGYVHNESGNIYSHLLGAMGFAGLMWVTLGGMGTAAGTAGWGEYVMQLLFFAGAIGCLGCSAAFHLFSCHSEGVCKMWNRCDHVGIVLLIVGSSYPAIYYVFYCYSMWQGLYLGGITVLGLMTGWSCFSARFQGAANVWARTLMFIALGCAGIIPMIHAIQIYGMNHAVQAMQLRYYLAMGGLYIFGAVLYAARIPEKWFPGRCDYIFQSHQIFHVCVVAAAYAHYLGITRSFDWRHTHNPMCLPGGN